MRQRSIKLYILILLFGSAAFVGGWYLGNQGYAVEVSKNPPQVQIVNKEAPRTARNIDFSTFWEVWETLNTRYVNRPLDSRKLFYGALKGLTAAVGDPYTAFLPPSENEEIKDSLNGKYEGIGAELGMRDGHLAIISPLDGSPAQAIGVKPGDLILKINDEETATLSLSESVSRIRGPAGTAVRLTLKRGEGEPFEVEIKREQIKVKSVSWEDKGDGVFYIRVSRFGEDTGREWDGAVSEILTSDIQSPKSVILDVRSNPGGYLQASVHLASEFVRAGTIVTEEFGDGRKQALDVNHRGWLTAVPVVVMIDAGSASASEILAASLRDLTGAKLVGQRSFGKGTVQDVVDFPDGSGLHVTIARWLTPKGENIDGKGLAVDVEVARTEEDVNQDKDPQLDKALEIADGKSD